MIPTYIGVIQVIIGTLLLFVGSVPAMFAFVMVSDVFGGSAAFSLFGSGLSSGGSSIPPVQFAMVFLLLRLILPSARQMPVLNQAARANALLMIFVAYGLLMALLGPRVFAGQMDVTPMRGRAESSYSSMYAFIYATQPLHPSSQNITTSIYLVGTLLLSIASYTVCRRPGARDSVITWAAVISVLTTGFGLLSIISPGTPLDTVLKLIRNGNYAMLDQSFNGFVRMTGVFPEASSYAMYTAVWMVFMAECWLRNLRPLVTGICAVMMAAALVFCTSASGYIALAVYATILVLRFVVVPGSLTLTKTIWLVSSLGVLVVFSLVVMVLSPHAVASLQGVILHMTVEKGNSLSGLQRKFWALQGWHAFVQTFGLGIGPGSFRSSSLLAAILGCTGVVGSIFFIAHLVTIMKFNRGTTYLPGGDPDMQVGAAASWAVLVLVLVQSFASASCDPGPEFGLLSGVALAMRMSSHARRPRAPAARLAPFTRRALAVR